MEKMAKHPVAQWLYGASYPASFSTRLSLLNRGVIAIAHIRGGGKWGASGMRMANFCKNNTFTDFIALC